MKTTLEKIAYGNVGLIFINKMAYNWAKKNLSASLVKKYFSSIVKGDVIRYELDNINALNFILKESLGGGGSETLLNDAQGKTHAQLLLTMNIDIPKDIL